MLKGLDPTLLEDRLWKWFRVAEEVQAVLLIDEADVFLHQRGADDSIEKESIVTGMSNPSTISTNTTRL